MHCPVSVKIQVDVDKQLIFEDKTSAGFEVLDLQYLVSNLCAFFVMSRRGCGIFGL